MAPLLPFPGYDEANGAGQPSCKAFLKLRQSALICGLPFARRRDAGLLRASIPPAVKIIILSDHSQHVHEPRLVRPLEIQDQPIWIVILASWGIALFKYVFQVPANRYGSSQWSVTQLKVLQECIALVVFTLVTLALFGTVLRRNNLLFFALVIVAVYLTF